MHIFKAEEGRTFKAEKQCMQIYEDVSKNILRVDGIQSV